MSVPSAKKSSYTSRKRALTHKRRQNQNAEISELASLVPLSMLPSSVEGSHAAGSLVPSNGHNSPAMDKLSVLRLVSSYLKLQQFMKETTHVDSSDVESTKHQFGEIEKAIDGFLIVLDKDANILYVSETIIDCVGLRQQDVIGQSLVDITHSTSAVEITDGLKPSVAFPSSVVQPDGVFSQFRQFYVRFKSTVYNSRITSHTMIQVNGNLKVKLPPSKVPVSSSSGEMELVEPSVVSFIGECHRIESDCSAMDVVLPLTTFSWTKTLDRKLISIDPIFKDIIGYDPDKLLYSNNNIGKDLIHPGDSHMLEPMRQYFLRTGHVVSPLMRVLNSSGEWVLMTIETTLRYNSGTAIPLFLEFKARVISPGIGKVKYAVHRKPHSSASNGVSDTDKPATEDGDNIHSTKSKNNKETTTKASGIEVLKGVNLPDSIRDVLLTSIREHAKPAPGSDNATCCESTAKNNTCSSGISSEESQPGHEVLDPDHSREHQPPQFLVDQLPAAKTQGTFASGSSSASSPVSIATSSGNPDSSQAPSFSKRLTCSSAAQPGLSSSSPLVAHDQIQAQSDAVSCTGIEKPHTDKDSTPVDSHSTSEDMEQGDKFGSESQTGLPSRSRHPDSPPDNVSSQGSCDLDFNFPSCAAPCVDAPSNSTEHVPNLEELMMPGVQNLTLNDQSNHCNPITQQVLGDIDDPSNHCDPIMQQVLGDIDIMNNDFNLEVGNSMASDPNGSKSSSMYSCSILPQTNFLASIIPDPESLQRDPNIMTNELNHEVHDILQQFM